MANKTAQDIKDYVLWQIQRQYGTPYGGAPFNGNGTGRHDPGYTLTDTGNGRRFADKFKDEFRHIAEYDPQQQPLRGWLHWDGTRWKPDIGAVHAQCAAKTIAVDVFQAAQMIPTGQQYDKARTAWFGWAKSSGLASHVVATLKMAASEPAILVYQADLDANDMLLNCPNGTLNLDADEDDPDAFYPARREDLLTKVTKAEYHADAHNDEYEWAMRRFMPDTLCRQDLLQALAYSLPGREKEHSFVALGETKTGKSTVINMHRNALGDYAVDCDFEVFATGNYSRAGGAREDMVALVGQSMVVVNESNENARLNAAQLKRMTGAGDKVSLRANYGTQFTMLPTFALWFLSNHEPRLPSDDAAVWERVHVFKFDQYIPPEERDEAKRDALLNSPDVHAAALAAMVRRWRQLVQEDGTGWRLHLGTTEEDTRTYRETIDPLTPFLRDCCNLDEWRRQTFALFKRAFRYYLWQEGIKEQFSDTRLGKMLGKRFAKADGGDVVYSGFDVKEEFLEVVMSKDERDARWQRANSVGASAPHGKGGLFTDQ